jgi:hypothetical protein
MPPTQGHHLILGELVDFITGETIPDTHDERYRQKLARLLVEDLGYVKEEIESGCSILVKAENKQAMVKIDFKVILSGRIGMIIKYGPGSLVTRRRPALAMSRLISPYQVPIVVVSNGENAEIVDGATGKIISTGLAGIPKKPQLVALVKQAPYNRISSERAEIESRVVYAFEIDGSCPCDDTVCRL